MKTRERLSVRSGPRAAREASSGFALLAVTILLFVMTLVGMAFFSLAGSETRATQNDLESQRAFWLAEAGRERAMRWMATRFRPPDDDMQIFDGEAGPEGGSYSVRVLVDTTTIYQAQKAFILEAIGESRGRQRRTLQRIRMTSFALYGYFTDDEKSPGGSPIWFASVDQIEGLIHSNGTIRVHGDPRFLGHVTCASDHMIGHPSYMVYEEAGWPIGGNDPYFADGLELGVTEIPLPTETSDLKDAAQSGGLFLGPATDIELGLLATGVPSPGWLRYRNTPPPNGPWSQVQIATLSPKVIYCNNDIQLQGVLDGELTISSKKSIVLLDDLTYLASDANGTPLPGCNDLLGLVAEENIIFDYNPPLTDDLKVNAVLMALGTSITAEDHDNYDLRGSLTIWGGLIQKYRGPVGLIDGDGDLVSGYAKNYHYDPRVTARTPPEFPLTGIYDEISWTEHWNDPGPF